MGPSNTHSYLPGPIKLVIASLIFSITATAAEVPIPAKTDSSAVYRNIETFSKKSGFTRFMYGLVFIPVSSNAFKKKHHRISHPLYRAHEGKVIREITVVTMDPFGYSASDTGVVRQNLFFNTGNTLHFKSRGITIRNMLLVNKNQPFDSLLVKESERLVRNQAYVQDVFFVVEPAGKAGDSVDLFVRVLDKWSISPGGAISPRQLDAGITENNFLGLGHEFHNAATWDDSAQLKTFSANYSVPNIRNSYISTVLHYNIDHYGNSIKSIDLERPFYSPIARWAAGFNNARLFRTDVFPDTAPAAPAAPAHLPQNITLDQQDYWAGTALKLLKGTSEDERTTNAIFAGRYLRIRYLEKPDERHDSLHSYSNEDFYLCGIGISTRKYFRDNYIFNFGAIEDVPAGKTYGMTGGYQYRDNTGRIYLGSKISWGNYKEWGYLSAAAEYGTFLKRGSPEQGVFTTQLNYFSNLFELGNWRLRQFIKPQVTWGMDRFSYDSLTINDEFGIRGFNSTAQGTKKVVLTLQTQSYAPWKVLGFMFGPYLTCSLGMLGTTPSGFKNSAVFSQIGLGALIKNNYLVINNFQLSMAYYPSIPGKGFNIIKFNAFTAANFGFRDFNLGKPEPAAFQ